MVQEELDLPLYQFHDDLTWVRCPECGFDYQKVQLPIQTFSGEDDYKAPWIGKGDLLVIPFVGECGAEWDLCFGFHKGRTATFLRIKKECPQAHLGAQDY